MILFHGSTVIIKTPQLIEPQRLLDFGAGFYTTQSKEQAENWAIIKCKRAENKSIPVISYYEFDDSIFKKSGYKVKLFENPDEKWLDFVMLNRTTTTQHEFDLVKSPVANDTLFRTLTLFESGILTKTETISRLKTHLLYDQISFNTEKSLKLLNYKSCYNI